jgi:hypothetical protein
MDERGESAVSLLCEAIETAARHLVAGAHDPKEFLARLQDELPAVLASPAIVSVEPVTQMGQRALLAAALDVVLPRLREEFDDD